jgi:hypothetical protein
MTTVEIAPPAALGDTAPQTAPIELAIPPIRVGARSDTLGSDRGLQRNRTAVSTAVSTTASGTVHSLDIWSDDRPSLQKLWWYVRYGQWTGERTPARVAGAVYATLIALPVTAAGYLTLWLVERPGRLAAAAVLTVLTVLAL